MGHLSDLLGNAHKRRQQSRAFTDMLRPKNIPSPQSHKQPSKEDITCMIAYVRNLGWDGKGTTPHQHDYESWLFTRGIITALEWTAGTSHELEHYISEKRRKTP